MAWSTSNISAAMVSNLFAPAAALSWSSDTIDVALYNNTGTPNKNDTFANNSYNAAGGQWVTANEVYQAGQWAQGGVAAGTKTNTFGSGTQQLGAANTASGSAATLASVYGCLVYDATLAAKGAYCWNYFGGAQSVTSGTFTVIWSGSGILQFTIS
jgi:hypothetical protein